MIKVGVVGGSGYTGGELLRLLSIHPEVEITWVTSRRFIGKNVSDLHPNLRKFVDIKFTNFNRDKVSDVDLVFLCLPHTKSMEIVKEIYGSVKIIDLSADFRLKNPLIYEKYYTRHICPELLEKSVYGLPEIYRDEIKNSDLIANPGCNSTAIILGLYPIKDIIKDKTVIVDVKEGSSASGRSPSMSNIHAERSHTVRIYKPKNHRHLAEVKQILEIDKISMSAHAVGMSRGVVATTYIFGEDLPSEKELWRLYRDKYSREKFIRIVNKKYPPYNLPDIKGVAYSNFCDIGFRVDNENNRLIVFSAIDNLIKGAAGQAIQNMNLMFGFDESLGLWYPGFMV